MTDEKRPYRMTVRADRQDDTRRRITESAVALHGSLGPSRTSMSAVAEHAGVRRSTLYRHFPDEQALYAACSSHWSEMHPAPDFSAWAEVADPHQRLRRALLTLYAFYEEGEDMLANLYRDLEVVDLVRAQMTPFLENMAQARDALAAAFPESASIRAAVGHAIAFTTWRSLSRDQGLNRDEAVSLMCRFVEGAGAAH